MNKIILSLFSVLIVQILFAKTTYIGGHFDHPKARTVTITYKSSIFDYLETTSSKQESDIDNKNNFMFKIVTEIPLQFYFLNGDKLLFFNKYAAPGDSLWLEIKDSNTITASGNCGTCINFMFAWESRFNSNPEVNAEFNSSYVRLEPKEYYEYWDKRRKDQLDYLNEYFKGQTIPKLFRQHMEDEINYDYAVSMLQYCWRRASNNAVLLDTNYIRFLDNIKINNPDAINSSRYIQFLRELPFSFRHAHMDENNRNDPVVQYYEKNQFHVRDSIAKKYFSGKVYDLALYQIFYEMITITEMLKGKHSGAIFYNEIDSLLTVYNPAFTDRIYHDRLISELHEINRPSSLAPDFKVKDLNGKDVRLSDFKGKVVYLDFWATNCAPCISEIPEANKLKEKFKDKDVVFLYISLDHNKGILENFIKSRSFNGIHLVDQKGFASDVAQLYKVNAIPHYFLIDKKGYLINSNAPRPSSHPEELIEKLLQ